MNEIIDAFHRIIPTRHRRTGRGWITFNCPSCGDRRGRGGFLETPSGGWRYRCFNGGCEYERGTGWEPGNRFYGRPHRLFELLGGDIADIPKQFLEHRSFGAVVHRAPEIANDFQAWPSGRVTIALDGHHQRRSGLSALCARPRAVPQPISFRLVPEISQTRDLSLPAQRKVCWLDRT